MLGADLFDRRKFLKHSLATGAAARFSLGARVSFASTGSGALEVGQAEIDITPPVGTALGGYNYPPGQPRVANGIRQRAAARVLVLRLQDIRVAIVSLDLLGVSAGYTQMLQKRIATATGIPADHIRVCASHSHSMPTFRDLILWGLTPKEYSQDVAARLVKAAQMAGDDLAPAALYVGSSPAEGGNSNRLTPQCKTDKDFTFAATDDERWLDTLVQVLRFERCGKPDVLWYHFSAHPVCYADDQAGPDWVGSVVELVRQKHGVAPGFLQGHCGDVNSGNGTPWQGDATQTSEAVAAAIDRAISGCVRQDTKQLQVRTSSFQVPCNMELLRREMEQFRDKSGGDWIKRPLSQAWYEAIQNWDLNQTTYPLPMTAVRLGSVGLLFHGAELFSYYGLEIRHKSPLEHTLVVGYTDDLVGYLTDPKAHAAAAYEATVGPHILALPPFAPDAARQLVVAANALLKETAA